MLRDKKYNRKYKQNNGTKGGDSQAVEVVNDKFAHIQPVQAQPLEVKVFHNNFDKALRAFRALVQKERILSLYKDKQTYEKPSDKNRRKRNEMKRTMQQLDNPRTDSDSKKSYKPRKPKADNSAE